MTVPFLFGFIVGFSAALSWAVGVYVLWMRFEGWRLTWVYRNPRLPREPRGGSGR